MIALTSALLPVANGPVELLKMSAAVGRAKVTLLGKVRVLLPTWPDTLPKEAWVLTVSWFEEYWEKTGRVCEQGRDG